MSPLETAEYFIIKLFVTPLLKYLKYVDFVYLKPNKQYYSIFISP